MIVVNSVRTKEAIAKALGIDSRMCKSITIQLDRDELTVSMIHYLSEDGANNLVEIFRKCDLVERTEE
jgi:hypothetical protein